MASSTLNTFDTDLENPVSARPLEPLAAFFDRYHHQGFIYNPDASAAREFSRLCMSQGWVQTDCDDRKAAETSYGEALVNQFKVSYGSDATNLDSWHFLLARFGIKPENMPYTIAGCKKIVRYRFVNLVDLIDARNRDPTCSRKIWIPKFSNEESLGAYTRHYKKYFPKAVAKEKGILKYLLRQVKEPTTRQNFSRHT